MRQIAIQEGLHTISVYLPPEAVEKVIKRAAEGITVVFKPELLLFETSFMKEGEFSDKEHDLLVVAARDTLITFYSGEKEPYDEDW